MHGVEQNFSVHPMPTSGGLAQSDVDTNHEINLNFRTCLGGETQDIGCPLDLRVASVRRVHRRITE